MTTSSLISDTKNSIDFCDSDVNDSEESVLNCCDKGIQIEDMSKKMSKRPQIKISDQSLRPTLKLPLVCGVNGCRLQLDSRRELQSHQSVYHKNDTESDIEDNSEESTDEEIDDQVLSKESNKMGHKKVFICGSEGCGHKTSTKREMNAHKLCHTVKKESINNSGHQPSSSSQPNANSSGDSQQLEGDEEQLIDQCFHFEKFAKRSMSVKNSSSSLHHSSDINQNQNSVNRDTENSEDSKDVANDSHSMSSNTEICDNESDSVLNEDYTCNESEDVNKVVDKNEISSSSGSEFEANDEELNFDDEMSDRSGKKVRLTVIIDTNEISYVDFDDNNNKTNDCISSPQTHESEKWDNNSGSLVSTPSQSNKRLSGDGVVAKARPVRCKYLSCRKWLTNSREEVSQHIKTDHECDICHMLLRRKSSLNEHKRIHTENKAFVCDVCHKRVTTKHSLTQHIRIHTGEKPFLCKICGHRSNHKQRLAQHILTLHKNIKKRLINNYVKVITM